MKVVSRLREEHAAWPDVDFVDGGTLSFTLAETIGRAEALIVIDAAQTGEAAGNVRCWVGGEMDTYLAKNAKSVHEVGLADLLDICRLTGSLPDRRALIGLQPETIDWGESPSLRLSQAIPKAARQVRELVEAWQIPSPPAV